MIHVQLPDGSSRELADGASAADLAAAIGPGLAKAAVAAKVDGDVVDLARPLPDGVAVALLTKRDPLALEVLRHSAAHLMADAILRLFPAAQLTIGPVVEDGFYYDIHLPEGKITPDDFPAIEEEMGRIAAEDHAFQRCVVRDPDRDEVCSPKSIAPKLIRFPEMPVLSIPVNAISMDSGMADATINPERIFPRNKNNMAITNNPPSHRLF
jgi:hypothetical protein